MPAAHRVSSSRRPGVWDSCLKARALSREWDPGEAFNATVGFRADYRTKTAGGLQHQSGRRRQLGRANAVPAHSPVRLPVPP